MTSLENRTSVEFWSRVKPVRNQLNCSFPPLLLVKSMQVHKVCTKGLHNAHGLHRYWGDFKVVNVHVHIPFDDHVMFYRTTIMAIVSPLFVASVASLTLAMTTIGATINLLQQMKILPSSGTCSSCNSPSGSYKTEGLYPRLATTTSRSI